MNQITQTSLNPSFNARSDTDGGAGRSLADLQCFIGECAERIASLTLVCPTVLNPRSPGPLDAQWEPLNPALSARYCTVTLGGPLFTSVASLEESGRSGYMAIVRGLLDALAIESGESVLEVGCGTGVIMRELARRTAGANRLIGRDVNTYLLREARALARRAGLLDLIDLAKEAARPCHCPTVRSMWHYPRPCSRKATPRGCWRRSCG